MGGSGLRCKVSAIPLLVWGSEDRFPPMNEIIQQIADCFNQRGREQYGKECVNQLQHALQSATLAQESAATPSLVAAALLHDIGHILDDRALPESVEENLDDQHEERGHAWLKGHFGEAVAAPVRLHVLAKRYLCTKDASYESQLSETSRKSFHDQGGVMSSEELQVFESDPHWREALEVRRWDDLAKDPNRQTASIESFLPLLESCLSK